MRTIPFSALTTSDLLIDAVYESDRSQKKGALGSEPLSKLMGVGNLGGFRPKAGKGGIMAVVLTSTRSEPEWPDSLDVYTGTYTYFGDNRSPGVEMHQTKQRGNQILRDAFALAHGDAEERARCPLFFIFETGSEARDFIFRGLAVPGSDFLEPGEDLVAVWRSSSGERFQNYRATFTVLREGLISGAWLRDSFAAGAFLIEDLRAPSALVDWVTKGILTPLVAERTAVRSVDEQTPVNRTHKSLLAAIRARCEADPWLFEKVAAEIWKMNCPVPVEYELTRRFRDGGRDATGWMLLGPTSDHVRVSFALEAKHYAEGNTVGVRDTSRLISRIKHREFGVFVTTSAVGKQAYTEIRDDGHPIVVIAGRDICEILAQNGITTADACGQWLDRVLA
ncbi:MAG: restriction endonuclease [Pontimonas sp.]|nr:restriction endonuclease [Pontimonas sp.]